DIAQQGDAGAEEGENLPRRRPVLPQQLDVLLELRGIKDETDAGEHAGGERVVQPRERLERPAQQVIAGLHGLEEVDDSFGPLTLAEVRDTRDEPEDRHRPLEDVAEASREIPQQIRRPLQLAGSGAV